MTKITLRMNEQDEKTVGMPIIPRIGETIISEGKFFRIDELIYNLDRKSGDGVDEVYVLTSPRPDLDALKQTDK